MLVSWDLVLMDSVSMYLIMPWMVTSLKDFLFPVASTRCVCQQLLGRRRRKRSTMPFLIPISVPAAAISVL